MESFQESVTSFQRLVIRSRAKKIEEETQRNEFGRLYKSQLIDHNVSSALRVITIIKKELASYTDIASCSAWDGRLVESQKGLETKVGLREDLIGAPGSVAWLYNEQWHSKLLKF
ncbi:hypothetical protein M9H77_17765 [Catharanthus roseus]|uniref:Uncharacterized protein n=1 Tax=Catharanthus roseus TaxID=4058 RepID=A0ACC0B5R6_CATRO|nr:hypothetical protein M9H77_17765 [Catharanthus roseus]